MLILNILIIFAIVITIISKKPYKFALASSMVIFVYSLSLLAQINTNLANLASNSIMSEKYSNVALNLTGGVDGVSVLFIILSTLLIVLCIMTAPTIKFRQRLFFILLFLTEVALVNVFAVTELLTFYFLFEATLLPMFLIIGIYGSRPEKIPAAYHFFLYTLLGSLLMLISILAIQASIGSTNIALIKAHEISSGLEIIFWLSFFASFAAKIPMFPLHLWLPKAHVEAPTAGSMLLAGILLKLGSYGFLRFSIFLFPSATEFLRPAITTLAIVGIIYSSFTILRQIDLKRIVAYSSVAHMSFVILGSFSGSTIALNGAILLMLAHGLVSSGLFLGVGLLYDRYKSRNLLYYRGLVNLMPVYTMIFLLLTLANLGFPPTFNFISELLIVTGLMESSPTAAILSGAGILFAGIAGFWIFTRIFFGNFASTDGQYYINHFHDLSRREVYALLPLVLLTIFFGLAPTTLLNFMTFELGAWGY